VPELIEDKKIELKDIQGVEIFSAGVWNGDRYTNDDLDEMVRAFNANKETLKPSLKLGHDDGQGILQKDGYPAAGWISNLYRKGSKLLADFIDIPEKVYELIKRGAYRKVSAEIYWDTRINDKVYGRMLAAVALLGADMPAVSNLSDMLALYGLSIDSRKSYADPKTVSTIKSYLFSKGGFSMDELKEAQAKIAALEEQMKAQAASKEELEKLTKYKEDAEKRIVELEKSSKEAELNASVDLLVAEKAISPSMKEYAKLFLGEEKKEYSINEKKVSKLEALKGMFGLHAEMLKVNTKENTIEGEKIEQGITEVQELDKLIAEGKTRKEAFRIVDAKRNKNKKSA